MNREGHTGVEFFVGPEVEHTPAFSKKTLFVIGKQDVERIIDLARENKTPHVFMGANHSFEVDPTDGTMYWDQTITALLDRGFWVTLDYPAHQHRSVLLMLNAGVWQSRMFVPLLRVEIPSVQTSSTNLTVKIDDVGFNATNPGVWCMNFSEVTDSNRFTDWNEYATDEIIVSKVAEQVTPATPAASAPLKESPTTIAELKEPVVEPKTPDINPQDIGLDPDSKSMLKPELEEVIAKVVPTISTKDAAAAYAEGTKEDPLSPEASKKTAKKVKA